MILPFLCKYYDKKIENSFDENIVNITTKIENIFDKNIVNNIIKPFFVPYSSNELFEASFRCVFVSVYWTILKEDW